MEAVPRLGQAVAVERTCGNRVAAMQTTVAQRIPIAFVVKDADGQRPCPMIVHARAEHTGVTPRCARVLRQRFCREPQLRVECGQRRRWRLQPRAHATADHRARGTPPK